MDPSRGTNDSTHQRLTDLRNGLLSLHKTLLDSEKATYERDVAKIRSPNEFLGLVMNDPFFAYLRDLSGLVVRIDERLDAKEPTTSTEAAQFVRDARSLLTPAEDGRGFERRYFEALQRDPDVVLAHGAMVRLLSTLAQPK